MGAEVRGDAGPTAVATSVGRKGKHEPTPFFSWQSAASSLALLLVWGDVSGAAAECEQPLVQTLPDLRLF